MFLSAIDILGEIERGNIVINPFIRKILQRGSIDFRLGDEFLIPEYYGSKGVIRLDEKQKYNKKRAGRIIIPPGEFILGTTLEYLAISRRLMAFVEGKSGVGRRGLFVHTAGLINPGFEGNLTLELVNANKLPIELEAERRICQITFTYLIFNFPARSFSISTGLFFWILANSKHGKAKSASIFSGGFSTLGFFTPAFSSSLIISDFTWSMK